MSMAAFMGKLKELKLKMAELENMEAGSDAPAEEVESPAVESVEEKAVGGDEPGEETNSDPAAMKGGELSDDEVLDLFGKKKKPAPKAGMKIAIAVGKPAAKGKYK